VATPDDPQEPFAAAFLDDYFAESDEHLTAIRKVLVDAEQSGRGLPAPALEELFRGFHSLKGLSGMVELREAELLAHHMEGYLRALRGRSGSVSADGLSLLIEGTGLLERVLASRRSGDPLPAIDAVADRLETLARAVDGENGARAHSGNAPGAYDTPKDRPRWRAVFAPSPELSARGVGVDRVRAWLREAGDIIEAVPRVDSDGAIRFEFTVEGAFEEADIAEWAARGLTFEPVPPPAAESPDAPTAVAAPAVLAPSHSVRVDLSRLDDLMRMIGDLVISRARLGDSLARLEPRVPPIEFRAVQENSLALERQLRDLREGVMRVRLVPVGEIFRRMPFVVRDLAHELDRDVRLEIRGQDTEIDKFLIERMLDPILHLVRNAVSHGIETAAERRRAGKPPFGTITLAASSVGDTVIIEVGDDGRGVDPAEIVERGRRAGLPVPDGPPDADDLLDILCAPGFSTRDEADRASGRGVGMAVVQTTIQELGGRLSLDTAAAQGTRFVIELPLTLAIADAIIVRVGTETFAVQQSAVREVVEVSWDATRALEGHEIAVYRGGVLPIVHLARIFGIRAVPGRALHVIVIGQGLSAVGLGVDRIVGQREIVVRTLEDALVKVEGIVGATDLGDGRAVLILDPQRLAAQTRERAMRRSA
jgi:two-component system, chemotaxis family, sensor kinase CheA